METGVSPDAEDAKLKAEVEGLKPQQFLLKTLKHGDRTVLLVVGGDPIGTLYGAYRLAEHLGVRFYLHGDVVPDKQMPLEMPILDETGKPLFDRRGIQPFHDFPEGPDWWNRDGYKADPRPVAEDGDELLRAAHLSRGRRGAGAAGLDRPARARSTPTATREGQLSLAALHDRQRHRRVGLPAEEDERLSSFGAAELFDRDDYGADYMRGTRSVERRCRPSSATPCSTAWASCSTTRSASPSAWASRRASARKRR